MNPGSSLATDVRKVLPWSHWVASIVSVAMHWWVGGAMIRDVDEHEQSVNAEVNMQCKG